MKVKIMPVDYNGTGRLTVIDCAKGISMLLVIVGHTITNQLILQLINSFHMPLFFIVSGITYKLSTSDCELIKKLRKGWRKLFIPGIILAVTVAISKELLNRPENIISPSFCRGLLLSLIWERSAVITFGKLIIPAIGTAWFLLVLFYAKTSYDFIHLKLAKQSGLIYILLFCGGVILGFGITPPFSLDIVTIAVLYMYVGNKLKEKVKVFNVVYFFMASLVWMVGNILLLKFNTTGSVGITTYRYYPFMYIIAIAGTLFTLEVCCVICHFTPILSKYLIYIGKHSILLLVVHSFDFLWINWIPTSIEFPISIIKIISDIIIMVIIERFAYNIIEKKGGGIYYDFNNISSYKA